MRIGYFTAYHAIRARPRTGPLRCTSRAGLGVVPWPMLMKPRNDWTLLQKTRADLAREVHRSGPVRGLARIAWYAVKYPIRKLLRRA